MFNQSGETSNGLLDVFMKLIDVKRNRLNLDHSVWSLEAGCHSFNAVTTIKTTQTIFIIKFLLKALIEHLGQWNYILEASSDK